MLHREFAPPDDLRDSIKCFWYNRRDVGKLESTFEVMPDGYAEIIFHFGSTCSVSRAGELRPLSSPFLMGLLNQPVLVSTSNRLEIIGIRCFPWAVFDLLGLPSGKDGVRTLDHPIARLQPALAKLVGSGRINEALARLREYFITARVRIPGKTTLSKAGAAMRDANGSLPVSQVAAAAHASIRTLERKFKGSSGYSVKDVSGLMRFEQVRNQLWTKPDTPLVALALELGFADQSHLSRDFKRYSGTTPAVFARKARQRKQSAGDDIVAFIQA